MFRSVVSARAAESFRNREPVPVNVKAAPGELFRFRQIVYTDARGVPFDYRGPYAQNEGTVAANPILHAEAIRRFNT